MSNLMLQEKIKSVLNNISHLMYSLKDLVSLSEHGEPSREQLKQLLTQIDHDSKKIGESSDLLLLAYNLTPRNDHYKDICQILEIDDSDTEILRLIREKISLDS